MIYTHGQMHLRYQGVALSSIDKTKLDIDKKFEPLYYMLFARGLDDIKPRDFLRSAVIMINTNTQDERIEYKKPIQLHMHTDVMKVPSRFKRIPKYVG